MKKIAKIVLPVILVAVLILIALIGAQAETIATEGTENIPALSGVVESIETTGDGDELETPHINNVERNGRNVILSWDAVDGAVGYRAFYKNGTSWKKIGDTDVNSFVWDKALMNKEYVYTVRCIDENGAFTSPFDKEGFAYTAVLDTPVLKTCEIKKGDVYLTWNKVNGASYYRVFFKGGSQTGWKKIADVTGTSYTWSGGEYNTEYTFTVRCVSADGSFESGYDQVGIKTTTKIDTPYVKNVSGSGASSVISWNAVGKGGKYRVFYKNGSSWKKIGDTDKTTYTFTGVTLGKPVTYTVRCVNSSGKFVSDYDKTGFTYTVNLPTPSIKSITTQGLKTAKLSWDAVNGAKKYRTFYKNGSSWKKIGDTAATSYTVTGMDPKATYVFTIRCVSDDGSFESDYNKTGVAHKNYLDDYPKVTSVTKASNSSVKVSYTTKAGVSSYRLYFKGGSQSGWKTLANTGNNPYTWAYVEPNENITYTVRALAPNGDVISDYDANGYTFKLSSPLLQTPKMNSVEYIGSKVYVKWTSVKKAVKYGIRTSSNNGASWKQVGTSTTNSFSYSASPDTTLLYSVVCLDSNGNVVSSYDTAKLTTIEFPAPELNRSSSVIKFTWKNLGAEKYEIWRNYYKTSGYQYYKTVTGKNYFEDTDVETGRGYFYKVKAIFNGGNVSCTSDPIKAVSGLCAPPTSITSRLWRFNLDWDGISFAEGYEIFYSTDNSNFKLLDTTKRWFYNTPKLTSGKKYYFRIRPYKYVGNEKVIGTYKAVSGTCSSYAYGQYPGSTYIEVSKNQQYMWLYVNGKLVVETPVVTGNYGTMDTPSGFHKIWQKESPATLVGPGYVTPVDYWLAFTYDGCGVHDATWRDSFGGNIYKGDGSHGCVNTPYSAVKKIYSYAYIGMPVIVYP